MLRRLFRRLFPEPAADPDWTAGWEHRRDGGHASAGASRRERRRPEPVTCRGLFNN